MQTRLEKYQRAVGDREEAGESFFFTPRSIDEGYLWYNDRCLDLLLNANRQRAEIVTTGTQFA